MDLKAFQLCFNNLLIRETKKPAQLSGLFGSYKFGSGFTSAYRQMPF